MDLKIKKGNSCAVCKRGEKKEDQNEATLKMEKWTVQCTHQS